MKLVVALALLSAIALASPQDSPPFPEAKSPVIPEADGYVDIPDAVVRPVKSQVYRAIFDATLAPDKPTELLPALNMAGSELNALRVAGVPAANARFAVVFHGPAIDGILKDDEYKARFGVANPNLPVMRKLKAAGVELMVCGQNLVSAHVNPKTLSPDVAVASDALIVLMTYHDKGYTLLRF